MIFNRNCLNWKNTIKIKNKRSNVNILKKYRIFQKIKKYFVEFMSKESKGLMEK